MDTYVRFQLFNPSIDMHTRRRILTLIVWTLCQNLISDHGFGIRHVQMICMSFCMVALLLARSSMGVAILAMTNVKHNSSNAEVYEWDKKTQGLILSSFFWGYMCMQIPAGVLAKRFGGKPILLVALLANGCLTGLFPTLAHVGGWPLVCVTRVAMGLTQACLFPASHTLLGRWLPTSERTTYTGIVYSGSQVGTIIAMPLSGLLSETVLGWKMIFYVTSSIMFLTAAMWYWFSASSPAEHSMMTEEEKTYIEMGLNTDSNDKKSVQPTPWREIFTTGALWAIVASHVGGSAVFILFFVDLPTYLERGMEISLRNSATLAALPFLGMWVGSIGSGILCQKIYNSGILSLGACRKIFNSFALFGGGLGIIALAFLGPDHKNIVIAILVLIFFLFGFTSAGFMVNHLDLSPQFAGVLLSLTNFAGGIGSILTPVATSLILKNDPSDISRWKIVFLLFASIGIGTNLIYIIFGSSERQAWDSPDYKDRRKADPEEVTPVLDKKREKELEANK